MATLPEGWAADYDGQRWFFSYTATSHVQYYFPKPGDEFPDFLLVGTISKESGLLPEEKLESERQVRKKAETVGGDRRKTNTRQSEGKGDSSSGGGDEPGEESEEGTFCFESFGYLGPGSYEDILRPDPVVKCGKGGVSQSPLSVGVVSRLTSASAGSGKDTAISARPPVGEASTKDFTIMRDETSEVVEAPSSSHSSLSISQTHTVDSRETAPSPAGFIAELVSESTARCEEEINPPPVELPDTGASWLEPRPVLNLVNQYPVELPAEEGTLSKHVAPLGDGQGEYQLGTKTSNPAGMIVRDENKSPWSTNWMSTSTESQAPARPQAVNSESHLPSRHGECPRIPPKVPHEERLHQEILDFFPTGFEQNKPLQSSRDAQAEPYTRINTKTRHNTLNHCPSVLRPGPRRSSQPPVLTARPTTQSPSKIPFSRQAGPSPLAYEGQPNALQPPRPRNTETTGRLRSQSVVERREVLVMPNPADHMRALRVPRCNGLQPARPVSILLHPTAPLTTTSQNGVLPFRGGIDLACDAVSQTRPRLSMPEPSDHIRMPAEPSPASNAPQGHALHMGIPLKTTVLVGAPIERSPPFQVRRRTRDLRQLLKIGEGIGRSLDARPPHNERDEYITADPTGAEIGPVPSTKTPSSIVPVTDEAPTAMSKRTMTSFPAVNANGPVNTKLRQILKVIGRQDGDDGCSAASVTAMGENGPQALPHEYLPPKGTPNQASEWSLGYAK